MLIGLTGKAGVGKSTVANILVRHHKFLAYALASPLKEAACVMFGWDRQHTDGDLKDEVDPKYGISPRMVLQLLGTEFGQFMLQKHSPEFKEKTGRNLWVKRMEDTIDRHGHSGHNWVITDVRFTHEAEAISYRGGYIWRITGPRRAEIKKSHTSENGIPLDLVDTTIYNEGKTEGQLVASVFRALRRYQ